MENNNSIEDNISEIIESLPEEKRSMAFSFLVSQSTHYQSPLPPPELMAYYDQHSQGASERFLSMMEREQAHRHTKEIRTINQKKTDARLGLFVGFIAFLLLVSAILYTDNNAAIIALGGIGAVGIIGHFVNAHKQE